MFKYMIDKGYVLDSVTMCDKDYYKSLSAYSVCCESDKENMVDVNVVFYVRTTRSNMILLNTYNRIYYSAGKVTVPKYFMFNEMGLLYFPHVYNDVFKRQEEEDLKVALKDIHVFPVGAFTFDKKPYVCYNVIIPDDTPTESMNDYTFAVIWGQSVADPIVKAMSGSFVLVKGGDVWLK